MGIMGFGPLAQRLVRVSSVVAVSTALIGLGISGASASNVAKQSTTVTSPDADTPQFCQNNGGTNRLYAFEWGELVRILGGFGRDGQMTPPAWRSARRR